MKKNRIRLSESQLHKVIKESVKKILDEAHGELTDLGYEENRIREKKVSEIFSLTDDIFEDYFNYYGQYLDDCIEDDGGTTLTLYLPENPQADYVDIDIQLKKIGWIDRDGGKEVYTYNLKYPKIDTPRNRQKQKDRYNAQNFTDPLMRNTRNRQGNKIPSNPNTLLRNNSKQFGFEDGDLDGMSDDRLFGNTNWHNIVKTR